MQSVQSSAGQLQPCGISSMKTVAPYTTRTPPPIPQINMSGSSYGSFGGYHPPQRYGSLPGGSPSMYENVDNYLASNSPRMGNYSPRNIPQIITSVPQTQSIFNWLFRF